MVDMSKSIQPLVIDPSFILCVHAAHFQITLCGTLLNTGFYFIWPKYQHSNHMLMSSYVDCQCFRFYLRKDSSLIIFQSMQHVSTQPYEVGCSTRWSYFNWASISTLKIKHWHPYPNSWFSVFGLRKVSVLIISFIRIFFCHIHCTSICTWSALTMTIGKCAFQTIFATTTSCRSEICGAITCNDFKQFRRGRWKICQYREYPESVSFQPHDSSCKLQWGFFHLQICRYTL